MENQRIKYYIYELKKCKEVRKFGNYIEFQFSDKATTEFYASKIINLANNLGKELFTAIDKDTLIESFVNFYKNHGYLTNNNSTEEKENKFVLLPNEIEILKSFFTKFHILYSIFSIVTLSSTTVEESAKLVKYFKLLNPDFENTNISNPKKVYYDFVELVKPYLNYKMNITFNIDFDDYGMYTKVISNNICDLCIFIFTDMISSNIFGKKSECQKCHKFYVRTGKRQKYCPKCQKTKNYNKSLDEKKIDIIKKLEFQYNNYDFSDEISKKLRDYISLKNKSRDRLETKIKDLKELHNIIVNSSKKPKQLINSGYNDY